MRRCGVPALLAGLLLIAACAGAETISGPAPGKKLAPLRVFAATGAQEGKELDYVAERGDKPTIYVLVSEWDRPVARFLKTLDSAVHEESPQALVVAIWLTADKEATKTYLPRAQQSLKFENTPLTVFLGDKNGPNDWDVNPNARVTVVIARKGVVTDRIGYVSINDTEVPAVREKLHKALK